MTASQQPEPLYDRLKSAEVYDEFCCLMFDEELRYDDLMAKLEEWGISSSKAALSRFNASHRGPWAMERAKLQEREFLERHGSDLPEATRSLIARRIFMDAASPNTSTRDVLRMAELEVQKARLQQDAIKLEQAERKLAQAQELIDLQRIKIERLEATVKDTASDLANKALTEEERAARMRARFGIH